MPTNKEMNEAKKAKKDEFYTQLTDIEKEARNYTSKFKGKVIYCNCDDPKISNFFKYFSLNFNTLGLKKLIATCYRNTHVDTFSTHKSDHGCMIIYDGLKYQTQELNEDGDFRSSECQDLLKEADVVVTNPPFSLFGEYMAQLIGTKKKFLVLGNLTASINKAIFPLFIQRKVWYGRSIRSGDRAFQVPQHYPLEAASSWEDVKLEKDSFGLKACDGSLTWNIVVCKTS